MIEAIGRGGHCQLLKIPLVLSPVAKDDDKVTHSPQERYCTTFHVSPSVPVVDVVQVDGLVIDGWPVPLEDQGICIVAGQVGYSRCTWTSDVSLDNNGLRRFTFMFPGESLEPKLVFRKGFCRKYKSCWLGGQGLL